MNLPAYVINLPQDLVRLISFSNFMKSLRIQFRVFQADPSFKNGVEGCWNSHLRLAQSQDCPFRMIFEDDCILYGATAGEVRGEIDKSLSFCTQLSESWDAFALGYFAREQPIYRGEFCILKKFYGSHAYILSLDGARKIAASTEQDRAEPFDHFLAGLKVFASPRLCLVQSGLYSRVKREPRPGLERVIWEAYKKFVKQER